MIIGIQHRKLTQVLSAFAYYWLFLSWNSSLHAVCALGAPLSSFFSVLSSNVSFTCSTHLVFSKLRALAFPHIIPSSSVSPLFLFFLKYMFNNYDTPNSISGSRELGGGGREGERKKPCSLEYLQMTPYSITTKTSLSPVFYIEMASWGLDFFYELPRIFSHSLIIFGELNILPWTFK